MSREISSLSFHSLCLSISLVVYPLPRPSLFSLPLPLIPSFLSYSPLSFSPSSFHLPCTSPLHPPLPPSTPPPSLFLSPSLPASLTQTNHIHNLHQHTQEQPPRLDSRDVGVTKHPDGVGEEGHEKNVVSPHLVHNGVGPEQHRDADHAAGRHGQPWREREGGGRYREEGLGEKKG